MRGDALEEPGEALGRDAGAFQELERAHVRLVLGGAGVGELRQHQADIGERATRSAEHEIGGGRKADDAHEGRLGVHLDPVAHLVGKDARDLVGAFRLRRGGRS